MSARKTTRSLNTIERCINELLQKNPTICEMTLGTLGMHKLVYERCYSCDIYTLNNLKYSLDLLIDLYEYDSGKLSTLAKYVRKIHAHYCSKEYEKIARKEWLVNCNGEIYFPSNFQLVKKINQRSSGECALCITFEELTRITMGDFVFLVKNGFWQISGYAPSDKQIRSWENEYIQLRKYFIPVIKEYDTGILNCHIIFELKLNKYRTDLSKNDYIFADAVIVCDDGFVVLEFKQRKSDVADVFASQALKYIKRLRFHHIGRHQSFRYTYLIFTKEKEDGVWFYNNENDFWYGNTRSVAKDLCGEFFNKVNPYCDITNWLTAGFKEKKSKYKG